MDASASEVGDERVEVGACGCLMAGIVAPRHMQQHHSRVERSSAILRRNEQRLAGGVIDGDQDGHIALNAGRGQVRE